MGDWVRNIKGLRSTDWQLQNNPRDVKYSTGNTVSTIAVTVVVPGVTAKPGDTTVVE